MKSLMTGVVAAILTLGAHAQNPQRLDGDVSALDPQHPGSSKFTPEQIATLRLKKLTLALDLTTAQQNQLVPLLTEKAKRLQKARKDLQSVRKDRTKMSDANRFDRINKRLDEQIAFQRAVKNILNKEQYGQWKKMSAHSHKHKSSFGKRRKKGCSFKGRKGKGRGSY